MAMRPKTLTAAFVPVLVGTALAYAVGSPLKISLTGFALLSAFLIQMGTNLVNDAIDFKKGADTAERIGPLRVTQSGLLSPDRVLAGAFLCLALAMLSAIPLVIAGGWPIVIVGWVSLFFAYGYTGGPFPLAYLGLGDLFVLIFFGLVAVSGVYFLHTGQVDTNALVAGMQIGFLATVLIAINNLRDREGDVRVGKRTLAVRWGLTFARIEITFLCLFPFVMNLYWLRGGLFKWAGILPLLALPLAVKLSLAIFRTAPGPVYNQFLARAAGIHFVFGLLWSIGCFLR